MHTIFDVEWTAWYLDPLASSCGSHLSGPLSFRIPCEVLLVFAAKES